MADIPPDTDVTIERDHSPDGDEDQQQRAVLPPPPRHMQTLGILSQVCVQINIYKCDAVRCSAMQ